MKGRGVLSHLGAGAARGRSGNTTSPDRRLQAIASGVMSGN
jgi:hypothetical protein